MHDYFQTSDAESSSQGQGETRRNIKLYKGVVFTQKVKSQPPLPPIPSWKEGDADLKRCEGAKVHRGSKGDRSAVVSWDTAYGRRETGRKRNT